VWCTGFEGDPAVEFSRMVMSDDEVVTEVVSSRVHRGAHAGLTSSPVTTAPEYAYFERRSLPLGDVIHVTLWMWRAAPVGTQQFNFLDVSNDAGTKWFKVAIRPTSGSVVVFAQPTNPNTTGSTGNTLFVPAEQWTCLRLEIRAQASAAVRAWLWDPEIRDEIEFDFVWDAPAPDMTIEGGYQRVGIGLSYNTAAAELYFDDVSVGTQPQPCE